MNSVARAAPLEYDQDGGLIYIGDAGAFHWMKTEITIMPNDKLYLSLMALILLGLISLFVSVQCVDENTRTLLIRENGLIEMPSAIGYILVLAIMLAKGGRDFLKKYAYLVVLAGALGLREFDFDTRFTTMGIFKTKFYLSTQVPLPEKIIALLVCLVLLLCLIVCIKEHMRSFLAGYTNDIVSMSVGISLLFMALSIGLDGLPRKLSGFGIETTHGFSVFTESIEEIVELGIPSMLMVSTLAFFDTTSPLKRAGLPFVSRKRS